LWNETVAGRLVWAENTSPTAQKPQTQRRLDGHHGGCITMVAKAVRTFTAVLALANTD
jgi:hypothetical protein